MWIRAIKLIFGASVAILLATFLGLTNTLTAGTVVLLSLGKTRLSSFKSAFVRVRALTIALILASVIFPLLNFTVISYLVFISLYILLIIIFHLDEGLIIGAVLTGQMWSRGEITVNGVINSISLFLIGISIAFLLNLYMPNLKKAIVSDQRFIEEKFRAFLEKIVASLNGGPDCLEKDYSDLETHLKNSIVQAQMNEDNNILHDVSYYGKYLRMRRRQFYVLKKMAELANKVDGQFLQGEYVADITKRVSGAVAETGDGLAILAEIEEVTQFCRQADLPKTREEFEIRAVLFQFLSELRYFVELKREFNNEYGSKN